MPESPLILPMSAVMATKDRPFTLQKTLESLAVGTALPAEIIIVDASESDDSAEIIRNAKGFDKVDLRRTEASHPGAALQRNQGVLLAKKPVILFLDDDILPETDCLRLLHLALESDSSLGGVNAMITNQQYEPPGYLSSLIVRLLGGTATRSDAGRLLAGIRNVLPATGDDLQEIQPVEWLNTTCTLYRKEALPSPAFPPHFHGASVCEDLALSLVVAQNGWSLANARLARIFHDSQGGSHKTDQVKLIEEEFTNRAYVLRRILEQTSLRSFLLLLLTQGFEALAASLTTLSPIILIQRLRGVIRGASQSTIANLPPHYAVKS